MLGTAGRLGSVVQGRAGRLAFPVLDMAGIPDLSELDRVGRLGSVAEGRAGRLPSVVLDRAGRLAFLLSNMVDRLGSVLQGTAGRLASPELRTVDTPPSPPPWAVDRGGRSGSPEAGIQRGRGGM